MIANKKLIALFSILVVFGILLSLWFLAETEPLYKEVGANYQGVVTINVVRVINPQFPALSETEFKDVLKVLTNMMQQRFGISVVFKIYSSLDIKFFFEEARIRYSDYTETIDEAINSARISSNQDPAILTDALVKAYKFAHEHFTLPELIKFMAEATNSSEEEISREIKDINSYMEKVAAIHFDKYRKLEALTLDNGKPLLNKNNGYHEFLLWNSYTGAFPAYDFVLTNQLVAGIETILPAIHASLRGGITAGFALATKAQYGSTVVVSTAPVILNHPYFTESRGENYSPEESVKMIVTVAAHEFGHSLAYRGHYFDHPGCIMNPTKGLKFAKWYDDIMKIEKCHEPHLEDFKSTYLGREE